MRLRNPKGPATALLDLLEEERRILLEGRLSSLGEVATRKERLLADLSGTQPGAAMAHRLRLASERNAGLLTACGEGIRAARRLVDAALAAPGPMTTYSADGRMSQLPASGSTRGTTA
jgi:flagellar biosynthesis/type III secretory pathway chaperone